MKFSQYNFIINSKTNYNILYNVKNDIFMVFDRNLSNIILDDVIISEKDLYIDIYADLVRCGAIIDDNIDEVDELINQKRSICNQRSKFHLMINPTLSCNFSCWYCYETHIPESFINEDVYNRLIKLITTISNSDIQQFDLSFFGGEPLLRYDKIAEPIIEYYYSECIKASVSRNVNFTSNGYLINNKIIDSFVKYEVKAIQITLDGSREQHNKVRYAGHNGSYDVIIQNIKKLIKNEIRVILRINYTTSNINGLKDILIDIADLKDTEKRFVSIDFQHVWQDEEDTNTQSGILDIISLYKSEGYDVSFVKNIDGLFNPCYADYRNQALVNYNGDVFKCTARDFKREHRNGFLNAHGEIIWENNSLELRSNFNITNQACRKCIILPLCGGGCSQKRCELSDVNFCYAGYSEDEKHHIIFNRFNNRFLKR